VDKTAAVLVGLGAVAGTVVGTRLLRRSPPTQLQWMFLALIVLISARLVFISPERASNVDLTVPVAVGYIAVGLATGIATGLICIGGGIIAVPLLISLFAVSDLVARGTSLLVSVPTSAAGTTPYRRAGLVVVRAGLIIGAAAAAASIPAVQLSLLLPARLSAQLFAGLLVLVAVQIGVNTSRGAWV
jgi:uncharacterized membrane protein YfcA